MPDNRSYWWYKENAGYGSEWWPSYATNATVVSWWSNPFAEMKARAEKAEKERDELAARLATIEAEHELRLKVIQSSLRAAQDEAEELEDLYQGMRRRAEKAEAVLDDWAVSPKPKPRRTINPSAALAWLKAQPGWWMSGDVDGFRVSCSGRAWLEHPAPTLTAAIIKLRAAMRKAGKL